MTSKTRAYLPAAFAVFLAACGGNEGRQVDTGGGRSGGVGGAGGAGGGAGGGAVAEHAGACQGLLGEDMVALSGGEADVGCDPERFDCEPEPDASVWHRVLPLERVTVGAFAIDVREVTVEA